jgi:hypothetical protein
VFFLASANQQHTDFLQSWNNALRWVDPVSAAEVVLALGEN